MTNSADLNIDQESWIGSLAVFGAIIGTTVSQIVTRYISARQGLIISAVGSVMGWSFIFSAAQDNYIVKNFRINMSNAFLYLLGDRSLIYSTIARQLEQEKNRVN